MSIIVLSGINITSGGMLSVYKDCIQELLRNYPQEKIIALVHRKTLFSEFEEQVELREFPGSKKSWLRRLYYEYVYFKKLSRELNADIWISMHDTTPNVLCKNINVYCHNSSPFFSVKGEELWVDWKITLFTWFYKYLYHLNIHRNRYVIVQQDWMRQKFKKMYGIEHVIVARPTLRLASLNRDIVKPYTFVYPTFPRMYKNIEVIGEALQLLGNTALQVYVTIDGSENSYAKKIVHKYQNIRGLNFIGLQSREEVNRLYERVDGLLFPSRLESWGMPLSEFAVTGKKIIAADLPYARENLQGYGNVKFFPVSDAGRLAEILYDYVSKGEFVPDNNPVQKIDEPYAADWSELFQYIIDGKKI